MALWQHKEKLGCRKKLVHLLVIVMQHFVYGEKVFLFLHLLNSIFCCILSLTGGSIMFTISCNQGEQFGMLGKLVLSFLTIFFLQHSRRNRSLHLRFSSQGTNETLNRHKETSTRRTIPGSAVQYRRLVYSQTQVLNKAGSHFTAAGKGWGPMADERMLVSSLLLKEHAGFQKILCFSGVEMLPFNCF